MALSLMYLASRTFSLLFIFLIPLGIFAKPWVGFNPLKPVGYTDFQYEILQKLFYEQLIVLGEQKKQKPIDFKIEKKYWKLFSDCEAFALKLKTSQGLDKAFSSKEKTEIINALKQRVPAKVEKTQFSQLAGTWKGRLSKDGKIVSENAETIWRNPELYDNKKFTFQSGSSFLDAKTLMIRSHSADKGALIGASFLFTDYKRPYDVQLALPWVAFSLADSRLLWVTLIKESHNVSIYRLAVEEVTHGTNESGGGKLQIRRVEFVWNAKTKNVGSFKLGAVADYTSLPREETEAQDKKEKFTAKESGEASNFDGTTIEPEPKKEQKKSPKNLNDPDLDGLLD